MIRQVMCQWCGDIEATWRGTSPDGSGDLYLCYQCARWDDEDNDEFDGWKNVMICQVGGFKELADDAKPWSLHFGTTCRAFGRGESGQVLGDGSLGSDGDSISRAEAGNCVDRYPLTGPGGNGWWISEGE